ncbi:sodium:solute symporter family protein [Gilvimarinus sp. SDUM040013]|uniref:Sodium:solute symporter family protein n=1 Tax=Gilvimarinus gilvus TaxID=3058038 RepID=A0ABU4S4E8_9GAMM|nr:sodium:solute symporter family protein [Gilvimarinus sp. SDUM040013]MDO3387556.1 sodium:solute symporter family protein [Gilvimarinus sp. SDUM040013]MDX6850179.1 sodium:solute symporter family protein [Gilvimarinus sp. SDUM040013]
MQLALIDVMVIAAYILATIFIGFWISSRASKNIRSYFLGGNKLRWYTLGLSNASGMFDISGTMWLVYLLFVYGLSSIYIPWLWPVFNQIFLMVFLSVWLRRSGVLTGAEWITFRFGEGRGAKLSHLIVVLFALVNVVGFLAYGFIGIGKFASVFLPWELSSDPTTNDIYYGLIITALTTVYVVKGGMFSVVFTEVLQFFIMTVACIAVGIIAMQKVSPEMLAAVVPEDWTRVGFGWDLNLDWSGTLDAANTKILDDGYSPFTIFFMLMLFSGVLKSLMGPAPNYDMQRILSARSPTEAAKMSGFVNVALFFPRYMLIAGLTVLALVFFMDELNAMGPDVDFEQILPFAMKNFVPPGLLGLLIAGLLAAFMSTFAATTNAAPAYIVNDIYKRYIKPDAEDKEYVKVSYIVSVLFVALGVVIGLFIPSLNTIIQWIVSAFYGAYTASNVLKWFWWRFNGVGYFCGMASGLVILIVIQVAQAMFEFDLAPVYAFPWIFAGCLIACVAGSLLSPADDMQVLKTFYIRVRPWGFWGPVYREAVKDHPELSRNTDLARDLGNIVVGIIWQTSMVAAPIFMIIQHWPQFMASMLVLALTSLYLWRFWWCRLHDYPEDTPAQYLPKIES